jgi:RimJ/RimL family protein N-acetyltransferase
MILDPISLKEPELSLIAKWRNESLHTLRSHERTMEYNQKDWVLDSQKRGDRYYFMYYGHDLVGYCGLDKIDNINKTAEIALLVNPDLWEFGHKTIACKLLLWKAFNEMNLNCIYVEVYCTSNAWFFWKQMGFRAEGKLRQRKFWDGVYYDSIIASILKEEFQQ